MGISLDIFEIIYFLRLKNKKICNIAKLFVYKFGLLLEDTYTEVEEEMEPVSVKPKRKTEPVNWDRELEWFTENSWVFSRHKGEWVAIKGDKFIAHDADYQKLIKICREYKIDKPFIQYIAGSEQEWDLGSSNYVIS